MKTKLLLALPVMALALTACESEKKYYDRVAKEPEQAASTDFIERDKDGKPVLDKDGNPVKKQPSGFAVIFNLETAVPEIPIVADFLTAYPTAADGKTAINADDADGTLYMECQDASAPQTFINCASVFAQQMKKVGEQNEEKNRILADDGTTPVNFLLDANSNPQTSTPIIKDGKEVFPGYNPVYSAIDDLDGFSTIAPFDVPLTRSIDKSTLAGNWYVVPVNYAQASPKTGEPIRTAPIDKSKAVPEFEVEPVSHASFGNLKNNVLRFTPKQPLADDTRYLIVLTSGIKDTEGKALALPEGYAFLNGNEPFPPGSNPAAAAARGAVQDWMLLATALMLDEGRTLNDVAMSYTFVTGGKASVMHAISNPEPLGVSPDSRPQARPLDFSNSVAVAFKDVKKFNKYKSAFVTGSIELPYYLPMPKNANSNVEGGKDQFYEDNNDGSENGYASCVEEEAKIKPPNANLFTQAELRGTGKILNPHCKQSELTAANVLLGEWQADDSLNYVNPRSGFTDGKPRSTKITNFFPFPKEYKVGDKVLKRNSNLQIVIPKHKKDGLFDSDKFCEKPASGWPVVIYQHDLFESRMDDATLAFAEQMAAYPNCVATVAIDLPLHGLMPNVESGEVLMGNKLPLLAYSNWSKTGMKVGGVMTALDTKTFVGLFAMKQKEAVQLLTRRTTEERFFGLTKEPNLGEIGYEDKKWQTTEGFKVKVEGQDYEFPNFVPQAASQEYGQSGSLFLNYLHFQTLRDNMRQAVLDLLNLNASIAAIDYDRDGKVDLDTSKLSFVGKGMGAIIGSQFVALNNANSNLPKVQKAAFIDVLGGLGAWLRTAPVGKDMVEFYSKLEPVLQDATCKKDCEATLKAKPNAEKDGTDYNTLMYMLQASLDSVDPLNYVADIKANIADFQLFKTDNANYPRGDSTFKYTGTDALAKLLEKDAPSPQAIAEIQKQIVEYLK